MVEPVDQYLRTFSWNKVKYRADKPLGEIIDMLQKVPKVMLYSCLQGKIPKKALTSNPPRK